MSGIRLYGATGAETKRFAAAMGGRDPADREACPCRSDAPAGARSPVRTRTLVVLRIDFALQARFGEVAGRLAAQLQLIRMLQGLTPAFGSLNGAGLARPK
jgi:hypothetical protein